MKIFFDDCNGNTELTPDITSASIKISVIDHFEPEYYVVIKFIDGTEKRYLCRTKEASENFIRSIAHEMYSGKNLMFVV